MYHPRLWSDICMWFQHIRAKGRTMRSYNLIWVDIHLYMHSAFFELCYWRNVAHRYCHGYWCEIYIAGNLLTSYTHMRESCYHRWTHISMQNFHQSHLSPISDLTVHISKFVSLKTCSNWPRRNQMVLWMKPQGSFTSISCFSNTLSQRMLYKSISCIIWHW